MKPEGVLKTCIKSFLATTKGTPEDKAVVLVGYDVKREGRRKDKLIFADRELFVYSLLFHAYLTSDVAMKVFVHPSIYCVYEAQLCQT